MLKAFSPFLMAVASVCFLGMVGLNFGIADCSIPLVLKPEAHQNSLKSLLKHKMLGPSLSF